MRSRIFVRGVAAVSVALLTASSASALTINLIDEGGVTGSQAALGFKIAAAYWESVITNNVTLNFGVAYDALPPNVIGSTQSFGQDVTVKSWEAGINATKSSSKLDQTVVLPTLSVDDPLTPRRDESGAVAMITSGNNSVAGGVNTAANKRVWDNDTTGNNSINNKVLYLNTANVKAIGGTAVYDPDNTQQLDASIEFSSDFGFDFNPTDGISPNTFDFIGTAIHEMGHALGFVSGVDTYDIFGHPNGPCMKNNSCIDNFNPNTFNFNQTSSFSALDMFRYSNDPTNIAPGTGAVLDESVGAASYFSINGGASQLFGNSLFSTGEYNGDGNQASHWKDTNSCTVQLGIMDPTECYQQQDYVTGLDLAAIDAIGWNLNVDVLTGPEYVKTTKSFYQDYMAANGAVPEPASWALMLAGFGLVGGAMRRRAVRISFAN